MPKGCLNTSFVETKNKTEVNNVNIVFEEAFIFAAESEEVQVEDEFAKNEVVKSLVLRNNLTSPNLRSKSTLTTWILVILKKQLFHGIAGCKSKILIHCSGKAAHNSCTAVKRCHFEESSAHQSSHSNNSNGRGPTRSRRLTFWLFPCLCGGVLRFQSQFTVPYELVSFSLSHLILRNNLSGDEHESKHTLMTYCQN
jgi:hypothetical protein